MNVKKARDGFANIRGYLQYHSDKDLDVARPRLKKPNILCQICSKRIGPTFKWRVCYTCRMELRGNRTKSLLEACNAALAVEARKKEIKAAQRQHR